MRDTAIRGYVLPVTTPHARFDMKRTMFPFDMVDIGDRVNMVDFDSIPGFEMWLIWTQFVGLI